MDQQEYLKEKSFLLKCMDSYYNKNTSLISDHEYDQRIRALRSYEEQHHIDNSDSPTTIVNVKTKNQKYPHILRMYSMKDVFTQEEMLKTKLPHTQFYVGPKFDGLSINLRYEKGLLVQALTRGNGIEGEDVTSSVSYIGSIPKALITYMDTIEIRGEIVLPISDFDTINSTLEAKDKFSNPRNAASGILRNTKEHGFKARLQFYPYGLGYTSKLFKTHNDRMLFLKDLGFHNCLEDVFVVDGLEQIETCYQVILSKRATYPIQLDGVVYRTNLLELENKLQYTGKYPNFMFAYKFPPTTVTSTVTHIEFTVGKTGLVVPIIHIEPVNIDGVIVTKVSYYNTKQLTESKIGIGSVVGVIRSGDVIPKIVEIISTTDNIIEATVCPACSSPLEKNKKGYSICNNYNCQAKLLTRLLQSVSRDGFNIVSLGEVQLDHLIQSGKVKNIPDIYKLTYADLDVIPLCKDKKKKDILQGIKQSKVISLPKFIYGLAIPNVGFYMAEAIAKELDVEWYRCKYQDFISIEGIGDKVAKGIVEFLENKLDEIEELIKIVKLDITDLPPWERPIRDNVPPWE